MRPSNIQVHLKLQDRQTRNLDEFVGDPCWRVVGNEVYRYLHYNTHNFVTFLAVL